MNPEESNELKFRMITPEGKEFPLTLHPLKIGIMIFGKRLLTRNRFSTQRLKRHLNTVTYHWKKQLDGLN